MNAATTDTATIRSSLEQTYQENRSLIAGLSDADMDRRTENPKWRLRQLAAHIAEDDAGALFVAKLLARGKNAKAPAIVVNLANWWALRKYRRARPPDLLPVLDQKHQDLMRWLAAVPPAGWQKGGEVSGMGRQTVASFLIENRAHSQDHAAELRRALNNHA